MAAKTLMTSLSFFAKSFSTTTATLSSATTFECIKTETAGTNKNVAVVTLHRPKVLNALCDKLLLELSDALDAFDENANIGAIVITGSEKAFAAGADIKEMLNHSYAESLKSKATSYFTRISFISKPLIAAVNGYALGGGCELAMMCDFIYAGEKAKFGQPEILIGTIPGAGGTQRLIKSVGKSKAMEIVLTGNPVTAYEAEKMGLVSKVFPPDLVLGESIKAAEKIASSSQIIAKFAKEAVNAAFETTLNEGINCERQISNGTFATKDRKEGMQAFYEKRAPNFSNE